MEPKEQPAQAGYPVSRAAAERNGRGSGSSACVGGDRSRKGFANLPAVGEFKQTEHPGRLVPVLVGDDGNAGGLAAGVEFDPDGLNLARDTVLQVDRKRVAAMDDRKARRAPSFRAGDQSASAGP
jgi:hypothetical protein